jgi:hypothetical protein
MDGVSRQRKYRKYGDSTGTRMSLLSTNPQQPNDSHQLPPYPPATTTTTPTQPTQHSTANTATAATATITITTTTTQHLEAEEQRQGLNRVVAPVDEVPHKDVARVGHLSPRPKQLQEVVKLAVNVSTHRDGRAHLIEHGSSENRAEDKGLWGQEGGFCPVIVDIYYRLDVALLDLKKERKKERRQHQRMSTS